MKRFRVTLIGLGVAAAVLGAPAAAQAGQHKADRPVKHHCQVAPKCRPQPLPKPPGGWPCADTKTCDLKHHRPICTPPVKPPHHKPPVAHPVPPILHDAPKPVTHQQVTVAAALPRTGPADVPVYLLAAGGLIGAGTFLRRLARVR